MTDIPAMANAEREAVFAELQNVTDDEWSAMTVCDPWTVRHLAAHMTALGNQTRSNFFLGLVKSGFSFDKFVAKDLEQYNQGSNSDVLAGFEKTLANPKTPPGPKYVSLGEYTVHGEDLRRALGRRGEHPEEQLVTLAEMYKGTGAPIGGKKRIKGLRLTASDAEWSSGDGPEVSGAAMDLILAMTGRGAALDACTGEGVETLRSRC